MLTDLYIDTHRISTYLPIDNYDIQVLGAYEDENGVLHLGPSYDDLDLSFNTLLAQYLSQFGGSIDANEFALDLCSLQKESTTSPITIQNVHFNYDQTRKQWLQTWIGVFRQYKFTDSNSPLIKKMNEIIIGREGNFAGSHNEFDLGRHNENFDKNEVLLAQRVVNVLTEIFGNYMFKEMLSGGVLAKDGTVRFMSRSRRTLVKINAKINSRFSMGTDYEHILDRFTSQFNFILPTDGAVDISDATISLSEVPVKFVLPMHKRPDDISLLSDFHKVVSNKIYEHFEAFDHFKREALEKSWRSQFYKTIMQICKDKGYNSLELSIADEGFRFKIFSQLNSLDFRNDAFDWLTSRGKGWVTLTHEKGELILSPADFRRYFKNDWAKFASSLYFPKTMDDEALINKIEFDLRYQQDFIIDTLTFIFDLAESAVNKRIVLYPHNAYEWGYNAKNKNNIYLPPTDTNLNEWFIKFPSRTKQIGFTLDLNDDNSVNEFIEMIPILLGNLLVRPATFIVRDPDHLGLSGSLLPSGMIGDGTKHSVPITGMRWTGGTEADYRTSAFYLRWNKIISRHNLLAIHKFDDPNKFYEIVRRILFTSVDDIAFYL